ncbi:MAG: hypothetical protein QOI35_4117, partial [Cryptosporangiaceae bacterium]|nr:hypothetical protein [Cryptosporangiaceae bacterium]
MAADPSPAAEPVRRSGRALLFAAGWAVREVRATDPLVDLRTLWLPQVRATNRATLLLGFGMFAAWMLVPLLVQQSPATGVGFGASAAAVGLYLLPTAAGTLAVTPLAGRLSRPAGQILPRRTTQAVRNPVPARRDRRGRGLRTPLLPTDV